MFNTLNIGIGVFVLLLLLVYISTFYKKTSQLNRFVTRMPIASQFILGMGIYITYLLFKSNYQNTIVKDTIQSIKDVYIQTLEILDKYKHSCPNLINSFFFSWQKDNNILINSFNNKDNELDSIIVSNYIFQNVGVYVQGSGVAAISDSTFLIFFSNFFRSKLLKNKWDKFKVNFGLRTTMLCDKLFEINEKYKFKSPEEIKNYFENYINTDEYKDIMNALDKTNVTQKNAELNL
jgi:hypothetical protein